MSMFEKASRIKLRFETSIGNLSTEDLWDLDLGDLDDIAMALHTKLENKVESFVLKEKAADPRTELGFGIVKRVIEVRLAEAEEAERATERRAKKQRILALIAAKEDEALAASSEEDLRKMLDEL